MEKKDKFSIRKFKVGAFSIAVSSLIILSGATLVNINLVRATNGVVTPATVNTINDPLFNNGIVSYSQTGLKNGNFKIKPNNNIDASTQAVEINGNDVTGEFGWKTINPSGKFAYTNAPKFGNIDGSAWVHGRTEWWGSQGIFLAKKIDSFGKISDEYSGIYQDMDVVENSEVVFKATLGSFGNQTVIFEDITNGANKELIRYEENPQNGWWDMRFNYVLRIPNGTNKIRVKLISRASVHNDIAINNAASGVGEFSSFSGSHLIDTLSSGEVRFKDSKNTVYVNIKNDGETVTKAGATGVFELTPLPSGLRYRPAENVEINGNIATVKNIASIKQNDTKKISIATVESDNEDSKVPHILTVTTKSLQYETGIIEGNRQFKYFSTTQGDNRVLSTKEYPANSFVIKMEKEELNQAVLAERTSNKIENDYTPASWADYQKQLARANEILSETDDTPINQRAKQTEIDSLKNAIQANLLLVEKTQAQKEAEHEIKTKAEEAKNQINATQGLSQEEKNQLISDIDKETDISLNNLYNTQEDKDVNNTKNIALTNINKAVAKSEIISKSEKEREAIEGNGNLSEADKGELKARIEEEKTKAIAAIQGSSTPEQITAAKAAGILEIDKEKAKAEVIEKAELEKASINPNLPIETQNEIKAAIEATKTAANNEIENKTSGDEVKGRKEQALVEIPKAAAAKEIELRAEKEREAIEGNGNLSEADKGELKARIEEEKTKAIAAIQGSSTPEQITAAKAAGILEIDKENSKFKVLESSNIRKKYIKSIIGLSKNQLNILYDKIDIIVKEGVIGLENIKYSNELKDFENKVIFEINKIVASAEITAISSLKLSNIETKKVREDLLQITEKAYINIYNSKNQDELNRILLEEKLKIEGLTEVKSSVETNDLGRSTAYYISASMISLLGLFFTRKKKNHKK